ncbi:TPA: hypothetical protein PKT84_002813 [Acinetobacter baumannii]|nr:hypothetical protein [Acinetobacter baumannii]HDI2512096.1 hypothetical protein [Acinetobacter baumannii]HDI2808073.1 hypothetical protein [Acinetobacter baumannii]HDI2812643.1 hypothetical protein [Acinetobacter baumannii]HDI2821402.1 hypothetical protein [Acinetobacter baumannii]
MISITDKIKQISGFSDSDSEVVKDSVLSLSTALWIMNILMSTNFVIGLTKRDQKLFDNAKETLITEMKRLNYNLSDYKVLPVSKKNEPLLLQIKLEQKSDRIIDLVNANLKDLSKDESMVIEILYANLMNSNSGVCITISDIHDKTALQVSEILTDISKELKVSTLSDVLDIYARPIEHNNAKVRFTLVNPWALSTDRKKTLCIAAPIFNEYNSPFKLIALLQNIIYLINQKCTKETDLLFDSINLPKFQNRLFGQSFFYIN